MGPVVTRITRWLLPWLLAGLTLGAAAQELVSVRGAVANLRAGPGTASEVLWQLRAGYPLQVLQRDGDWLRVRDFEGDEGWIAARLTGPQRHHVVRVRTLNLRAGPGTDHPVVAVARYGDVLPTLRRAGDWVQLRGPGGQPVWAAAEHLWGW
ncbi:hypothetical protein Tsedi_00435 [Tepidimonas sediminis]|uniref:SH3b domain-containing protein n=1 Tax=Tepidimonas sediminis TaxID=2588941 RepID=A0A554WT25_9BURK|nr:SH3 domain-containing protein [Tepidimonas sediminis]TSE26727.1 hypothetical protein Tsedi_00435 [Tepidimonas sediminis]